jgi:tetratricopeptide (TPR) repeat protein
VSEALTVEPSAVLARAEALYQAGKFVQAYQAAGALGDPRIWPGTDGRILGARLASQLGNARLGDAMMLGALRKWPDHPRALFYGAMAVFNSQGPLIAIELIEQRRRVLEADRVTQAECLAFLAYLYAFHRDFETAKVLIGPLLEDMASPWVASQFAAICELEDDYAAALAAARRALTLDANSRSAVQYTARFLSLQERDDEAIALLREALGRLESARIAGQLADLEIEAGQYQAALASLERYDALTPLKQNRTRSWLAGRRCDVYHSLGDREQAIAQAHLADDPFYAGVAQQLEAAGPSERRVMLPVGFVRQHHMTCAPATLSAVSRFWNRPAEHLDVAEKICYDGTPHHSERRWALDQGWHAREFTVTWNSARALIDSGVPFTLTTVQTESAHLQAVIGYDAARGTLLIRDPYERTHGEFAQAPFFASAAAHGPRGMALVPDAERARLDAIELPDAPLYDLAHELQSALISHERDRAVEICESLEGHAPGHRLALGARRSIAIYDGDEPGILATTEKLLAAYPDELGWALSKAASLRMLAPRSEALGWLESLAVKAASHPLIRLRYAQALLEDDRQRSRAVKLLRRVIGRSPRNAAALSSLGDANWQAGDYAKAVFFYRLAAAVEETDEGHAIAYFRSARAVRQEQRALDFLHARMHRLGTRSPQPAITLYRCLDELERSAEADKALDAALAQHPEDGGLMLFAVRALAYRDNARAAQLLERARSRSRRADWLQAAARLAEADGRLAEALKYLDEAAGIEPLDSDLQRQAARLRREIAGPAAALAALRSLVERFRHHQGLNELLVEFLEDGPLEEREQALRRLLELHPSNAWAWRELAWILGLAQRYAEAREAVEHARALAPHSGALYRISGQLYAREGKLDQARAEYRRAVEISGDDDYAIRRLVESCATLAERRAQLEFVAAELKRQVLYGDGVLTFQAVANAALQPQEVLDLLENAHAVRPDLWQTWIARIRQLVRMQQTKPALALCEQTQMRFPHLPRAHVERAEVYRVTGERGQEQQALREALRLSPGWSAAARQLAESLESQGQFAASRVVLESALRHYPSDPYLHGYLGETMWRMGEREAAVAQLALAVEFDPEYEWAWRTLKMYCREIGQANRPGDLLRDLTARRPGDVRIWRALAATADDPKEQLAAYDSAIAVNALALWAHEAKLDLLISLGRHDEVLAAAHDRRWGDRLPVSLALRVARAWHAKSDSPAAIATLEAALAYDPSVQSAWEQLAEWRREAEDFPGYVAAASEMVRLGPNDPICLGYLAHARSKADSKADVTELLQRALALKPDYEFAAFALTDRALDAGDAQRAEQVLDAFALHSKVPGIGLRRIRVAAVRHDRTAALARFRELLSEHADPDSAKEGLNELERSGWRRDGERAIDALAVEPGSRPEIGTLWVEIRRHRANTPWRFSGLTAVLANPTCAQHAARAWLRMWAGRSALRLRFFVWRHRDLLIRDDESHGLVGYALLESGAARAVERWFRRFPPRPSTAPWALLNLVCALYQVRNDEDAAAWARAALGRPEDHTAGSHRTWLALHAARTAQRKEAEDLLQRAGTEVPVFYQFVQGLTRALLVCNAGKREALAAAMDEMRHARTLLPKYHEDPVLARMWSENVSRMARAATANGLLAALMDVKLRWIL